MISLWYKLLTASGMLSVSLRDIAIIVETALGQLLETIASIVLRHSPKLWL
jgi:hypothetical protein